MPSAVTSAMAKIQDGIGRKVKQRNAGLKPRLVRWGGGGGGGRGIEVTFMRRSLMGVWGRGGRRGGMACA